VIADGYPPPNKLGEQSVDVFLAGSEQRNLDFTFKASDH